MLRKKLHAFITKYIDYFFFLLFTLSFVLLKFLEVGKFVNEKILLTNTLDYSWMSDNIERFSHGFIAGKDFIFTYGPLFQFIASIPTLVFHIPSYSSLLFLPVLLMVFICSSLFFIITRLTKDKKTRIILFAYLLFVINISAYDANSLFRILVPFVYILLYEQFSSVTKKLSLLSFIILSLPALFGLYIFELLEYLFLEVLVCRQ